MSSLTHRSFSPIKHLARNVQLCWCQTSEVAFCSRFLSPNSILPVGTKQYTASKENHQTQQNFNMLYKQVRQSAMFMILSYPFSHNGNWFHPAVGSSIGSVMPSRPSGSSSRPTGDLVRHTGDSIRLCGAYVRPRGRSVRPCGDPVRLMSVNIRPMSALAHPVLSFFYLTISPPRNMARSHIHSLLKNYHRTQLTKVPTQMTGR